jgi:hypothetical protein
MRPKYEHPPETQIQLGFRIVVGEKGAEIEPELETKKARCPLRYLA